MRETGANFVCTYSEVFGEERDVWQPPDYEVYSIRYENCVPTLSMFDRMVWEKSGGFKTAFPFNEDWEFWINCSRHDIVPYRLRGNFHLYRSTSTGLAHNYIKETWPISVATMMTANQDLYPASQVLWAHTQLAGIPDHWAEKFAEYSKMHDDQWLLKLWMGIYCEARSKFDDALALYSVANQICGQTQWQILWRIGEILRNRNMSREAYQMLHMCRILRPDTQTVLGDMIEELRQAGLRTTA